MSQLSRQIKKIGNYQIGDLLGRGSIGTVYKGLNLENGTLVAIKQVSLQTIRQEQHKAIQQEINLLKKLKHDNIVKYIDCIQTEGFLNIILEFIESGSLASIIKKFGSFPESLVAIYIKQVLIGLDYLHAQGVVHRDIKGANILTTKDGIVKLADFGVATRLSDDEQSISLVGTPYWMAPEIIEMRGHISTACDIWSLGCTVIESLTGNPPYFDLMQYPALYRIVSDNCPPLPEGISPECHDFLLQCFQKDPSERIDAKGLLKHPWIQSMQSNQVLKIIQSPYNELPEQVTNTIRMHIDSQQVFMQPVDSEMPKKTKQLKSPQDIQQQNLQVVNDVQSNFATILDEGSFLSMDGQNNSQPIHTLVQCQSPAKQKKSNNHQSPIRTSHIRDSQLDSLRHLKLRKSHQQNPFQTVNNVQQSQGLWGQNEDGKVLRDINDLAQIIINQQSSNDSSQSEQLAKNLHQINVLLQGNEKAKLFIINNLGLTCFLSIIDTYLPRLCCDEEVRISTLLIQQVLQLINQIVESDSDLLELACVFGALTQMIQVSSHDFPKELRVESAYFIGQLAYSSDHTLTILMASGGINSLLDFLDPRVEDDFDLVSLAIDSFLLIFELRIISNMQIIERKIDFSNLARILTSKTSTLCLRLTIIVDNLYNLIQSSRQSTNANIQKYLNKALDLMIIFAKNEDKQVKLTLCNPKIIQMLALFLHKFSNDDPVSLEAVHRVVRIFKYLSTEPTLIQYFENNHVITNSINLLRLQIDTYFNRSGQKQEAHIIPDLMKLTFYLTKLNPQRQQELALNDGISLILQFCYTINSHNNIEEQFFKDELSLMKKVSMAILCSLVQAGSEAIQRLWQHGGIKIYIDFLQEQMEYQIHQKSDQLSKSSNSVTKLLDTIVKLVETDPQSIQANEALTNTKTLETLVYCFTNVNQPTFQQIVPIFLNLVKINQNLSRELTKNNQFCLTLAEYIKKNHQLTPVTVTQLLNLLHKLLEHTVSPTDFLQNYNLMNVCQKLRGMSDKVENGIAVQQIAETIGILLEQESNKKTRSNKR